MQKKTSDPDHRQMLPNLHLDGYVTRLRQWSLLAAPLHSKSFQSRNRRNWVLRSEKTARIISGHFGGIMSRICQLTGKRPVKGSRIIRSGKAKKEGGIGTHVVKVTKRRWIPNLQRVKAVVNGEVKYIRVTAKAIKKGMVVKAPRRSILRKQNS